MIARTDIDDNLPQGPCGGRSVLEWTVNETRIRLSLADLDRLGCLLEKAELKPAPGVHLHIDAADLGQRLSYLGEILAIIEHDKKEGRAVLRSSPPSTDDTHTYFFELVVDRNEGLSLARHAYDRVRQERKMVAAPLTTYALGRLIHDLKKLASSC
jgi:hypothetical protein